MSRSRPPEPGFDHGGVGIHMLLQLRCLAEPVLDGPHPTDFQPSRYFWVVAHLLKLSLRLGISRDHLLKRFRLFNHMARSNRPLRAKATANRHATRLCCSLEM